MVSVLADLAIESEATTILMMRLAGAFDRGASDGEGGSDGLSHQRARRPAVKGL